MKKILLIGLYTCLIGCNAPKVDAKSKVVSTDTVSTIKPQGDTLSSISTEQTIIGTFEGINDEGDYTFVSINDSNGVSQKFICSEESIVGHGNLYVGKKVKGYWTSKKIEEAGSGDTLDAKILEKVDTIFVVHE